MATGTEKPPFVQFTKGLEKWGGIFIMVAGSRKKEKCKENAQRV